MPTSVEALNDVKVLRQKATIDLPAAVKAMVLVIKPFDEEAKDGANRMLAGIKLVREKIAVLCDPTIVAAKETLERAKAMKAELDDPPRDCDRIIRDRLKVVLNEEKKLTDDAAERKRLADLEQKRLDDESKKAKEIATKTVLEEEYLPRDDPKPDLKAPATTVYVPPKSKGSITHWKARVTDVTKVPREYMIVDQVALNKIATEKKAAAIGTVPGVDFYSEEDFRLGS